MLKPFYAKNSGELRQRLQDCVGDETAEIILERWQEDEAAHPRQFIYAAKMPFPMASIVFIPPREGIKGTTNAIRLPNPGWSRILFGTRSEVRGGVNFIDLYYAIDILPKLKLDY